MKSTIITTILLSSFPLFAENFSPEDYSSTPQELFSEEAQGEIASLEAELTLLDEEFDEFKNELFSLDEVVENDAAEQVLNASVPSEELESPVFAIEEATEFDSIPFSKSEIAEAVDIDNTTIDAIEQQAITQAPQENVEIADLFAPSQESPAILNVQGTALMGELTPKNEAISVDLSSAFAGSPIIYTLLFTMSVVAFGIWLYCLQRLRSMTQVTSTLKRNLFDKLNSNHFDEALSLCNVHHSLFSKMVASGIQARRHGLPIMIESMKAEGKRASVDFWQKLGMLNDIAILAPMLGLLGTVLGMFYAFYNINRSIESISTLFDGLGVSVGTTVAGLIVAILALMLHSIAKYKLVKALATVENEAQSVAIILDDRTSIHNKG